MGGTGLSRSRTGSDSPPSGLSGKSGVDPPSTRQVTSQRPRLLNLKRRMGANPIRHGSCSEPVCPPPHLGLAWRVSIYSSGWHIRFGRDGAVLWVH